MRVLVTGGAGFIGSHLVDRFVRDGFAVRVLDSLDAKVHPHGRPKHLNPKAEFIHGTVTDRQLLARALRGVDFVSHQAAYQDYMPDFSRFLEVNAVGTALLYEIIVAERLPVKKVIVASSQAVYGEGQYTCTLHGFFLPQPRSQKQLQRREWDIRCPQCGGLAQPRRLVEEHTNPYNQYAVSKLAQEQIALGLGWLYEIPTVALRYSITQGENQSLYNHYSGICRIFFSRALAKKPLLIYEDGHQTRDFLHVQDVVEASMLVLQKEEAAFQAFNVGSGVPTTVLDYAQAVCKLIDAEVQCLVTQEYRRGDNRHSVSSIERLKRLGWSPRHDLSKILADFLDWLERSGGIPPDVHDAYAEMQSSGVICKTKG